MYSNLYFYSLRVIINAAFIFPFAKKLFNTAPSRGSNGELEVLRHHSKLKLLRSDPIRLSNERVDKRDKRVEHPSHSLLDPCLAP